MRHGREDDTDTHGTNHSHQGTNIRKGGYVNGHNQGQNGQDNLDDGRRSLHGAVGCQVGGNHFFHTQGQWEHGQSCFGKGGQYHEPHERSRDNLSFNDLVHGQCHLIFDQTAKHVVSHDSHGGTTNYHADKGYRDHGIKVLRFLHGCVNAGHNGVSAETVGHQSQGHWNAAGVPPNMIGLLGRCCCCCCVVVDQTFFGRQGLGHVPGHQRRNDHGQANAHRRNGTHHTQVR
mmetsp:Transcript_15477/g.42775  ORF Transcript_15477/g.42775 Transcript_15477/m.42775 type:complete len:231 (+) Transcript_15477:119-811(+)